MGRKLPLNVEIDTISLTGFATTKPQSVTLNPKIAGYNGGPLYCHVSQDAATNVALLIDEKPPNSSAAPAKGPITTVSYEYQPAGAAKQNQTWNVSAAGMQYTPALPVEHTLVFTDPAGGTPDLSYATIQIAQLPKARSTRNSLGIVVLGAQITGDAPVGYFVSVPMAIDLAGTVDPTLYASMGIAWTPDMGIAGPIGGGTIP
jgi:hypothetical protein